MPRKVCFTIQRHLIRQLTIDVAAIRNMFKLKRPISPPEATSAQTRQDAGENLPPLQEHKRQCLCKLTRLVGAAGVATAMWPLLSALGPDEKTLADGEPIDIALGDIAPGQTVRRLWRGRLVLIRHRTEEEIAQARALDGKTGISPQADAERVKSGHEQWLVVYGHCPHTGCIPNEQTGGNLGWLCPCHGSEFDLSGRVTRGPATENLAIPDYAFHADGLTLRLGVKSV